MWPFSSTKSSAEPRQDTIAAYADCLEIAWCVGSVRSESSLPTSKQLIKMTLINALHRSQTASEYDVLRAGLLALCDFRQISASEERSLREFQTQLSDIGSVQSALENRGGFMLEALEVLQLHEHAAMTEREQLLVELDDRGLTAVFSAGQGH